MCDAWCVIPERSGPVSVWDHGPLYDTILSQSHYYKMSLIFVSSLSIGFFVLFNSLYPFRFWYICTILSLRNRTRIGPARSLFVRSRFPFQPPSLVLLHTHTLISSTRPICRDTYTRICICIFMYKQALRGVDSDPDSRADKNSSQSIYEHVCITMYMYSYV